MQQNSFRCSRMHWFNQIYVYVFSDSAQKFQPNMGQMSSFKTWQLEAKPALQNNLVEIPQESTESTSQS